MIELHLACALTTILRGDILVATFFAGTVTRLATGATDEEILLKTWLLFLGSILT